MSMIMGDLLSSISYISLLDFRPTTASLASAVLAEPWRGNESHQRPQHPELAARLERLGTSLVSVMKRWVHICCLLYGQFVQKLFSYSISECTSILVITLGTGVFTIEKPILCIVMRRLLRMKKLYYIYILRQLFFTNFNDFNWCF